MSVVSTRRSLEALDIGRPPRQKPVVRPKRAKVQLVQLIEEEEEEEEEQIVRVVRRSKPAAVVPEPAPVKTVVESIPATAPEDCYTFLCLRMCRLPCRCLVNTVWGLFVGSVVLLVFFAIFGAYKTAQSGMLSALANAVTRT